MAVRPHVPWYVRWAITLPFIFAAGGLVWWAYDSGLELAGFHRGLAEKELDGLRDRVAFLETENAKLINQLAYYERQAQIEQSAMQETSNQVKNLNEENVRLKEDLSFFQNLPLTAGREADLSIHRLKVEPDSLPGEYRCRLLLVQNVQQRGKEFQGSLQLLVNVEQDGKKVVLQFPQESSPEAAANQLNFKYYQRVDRIFKIPADVRLESVQVRVFEKGAREPKVKQTVGLS
ncbi:MAG: hypothetical protein EPO42_08330 [Gallionellaceae bacterium]|nr:MAG: hypothetical protein EPO42_08330 [Gallionellaceae bacterium]